MLISSIAWVYLCKSIKQENEFWSVTIHLSDLEKIGCNTNMVILDILFFIPSHPSPCLCKDNLNIMTLRMSLLISATLKIMDLTLILVSFYYFYMPTLSTPSLSSGAFVCHWESHYSFGDF